MNKDHLTEIQRKVTQENGTEKPFENEFWDFFEEGIYLDVVSKEPLFCSLHKYNSQCGWPSFFKALEFENIVQKEDSTLFSKRIEVRSKKGDSHLGHIFTDGPAPTGVRYCINSAALDFVAKKDLEKNGLKIYRGLFEIKNTEKKVEKETATFGAGCFWGVEAIFQKQPGVISAEAGYCGGQFKNPTYEDISTGKTGHAEVVKVSYDANVISYKDLVELFWKLHDPTTLNAQGYDRGTQYRSVIFFHNENQKSIASDALKQLETSNFYKNPIVTEITALEEFYPAEEYHQDYYDKKYKGLQGPICHWVRGV